jgi:hypothetical protein
MCGNNFNEDRSLPCSVAMEELMTGADLPSSIFYGGTQYRNGVTKGLITKADLPWGRNTCCVWAEGTFFRLCHCISFLVATRNDFCFNT